MTTAFVMLTKQEFDKQYPEARCYVPEGAKEYVYDIPFTDKLLIRIYSSVDNRTDRTRDVGKDAIRVCLIDEVSDKPVAGKEKRVHRTEGRTNVWERIRNRVEHLREVGAEGIIRCPACGAVLILRMNKAKGTEFYGCSRYPNCAQTAPKNGDGQPIFTKPQPTPDTNQTKPTGTEADPTSDYAYAYAVLSQPRFDHNSFAQSLKDQLVSRGSLSDKQLSYVLGVTSPTGRSTMEAELYLTREEIRNWLKEHPIPWIERRKESNTKPQVEVEEREDMANGIVATGAYKYHKYPFKMFNRLQTIPLGRRFIEKDSNVVVAAPTSSGKTILAELFMGKTLAEGGKVVYMAPLKALSQEKIADWTAKKHPLSKYKTVISTGDYKLTRKLKRELQEADIIVMTSEMLGHRVRLIDSEHNDWLYEVKLLVVDESHLLTMKDRGDKLEAGVMGFTDKVKDSRVLLLSATMGNSGEMARWLSKLNDLETDIVYTKWRPVELAKHFHAIPGNKYSEKEYNTIKLAKELAEFYEQDKFLLFVHSKVLGRKLLNALRNEGHDAEFHNADLDLKERLEVEKRFRHGALRLLISTSTTAYGLNLPARRVIVCGINRGMQTVEPVDIIQMIGRSGRYGLDPRGDAHILIPEQRLEEWKEILNGPQLVYSQMQDEEVLLFHVIGEIARENIQTPHDLLKWYERTLSAVQNGEMSLEFAEGLVKKLQEMRMIRVEQYKTVMQLKVTNLGRVCLFFYLSPFTVAAWNRNFWQIFSGDGNIPICDETIAWALAKGVPEYERGYVPTEGKEVCGEFDKKLRDISEKLAIGSAVAQATAYYLLLRGKEMEGGLKAISYGLRRDAERTAAAIGTIDDMYGRWGQKPIWTSLPLRIQYGVPETLVDLCRVRGIGGVYAKKLSGLGIQKPSDLTSAKNRKKVRFVLGRRTEEVVKRAKEMQKKEKF